MSSKKEDNNNNNNNKNSQKENNTNNINNSIRHSFINNPNIIKNSNLSQSKKNEIKISLKSSSQNMISLMKKLEPVEKNKEKNNNNKNNLECSFKDISQIEQNNNFILSEIDNSLFKEENMNETIFLSKLKYSMPSMLNDSSYESIQLGEIFKEKIMNAKSGEEIILPERKIIINYLIISHSIKIVGQTSSQIEITDGPIQININDENNNESVKINLVKIIFNFK